VLQTDSQVPDKKARGAPGDLAGSQPGLLKGDHKKPDLLLRTKCLVALQDALRTPFSFFSLSSFPPSPYFSKSQLEQRCFFSLPVNLRLPSLVSSVFAPVVFLFLSLVLHVAGIQLLVSASEEDLNLPVRLLQVIFPCD